MSAASVITSTLSPDAFQRHRFTTDDVQHLYHVYDNLSQTPYCAGAGIECGDINSYIMHPQHIITYRAMVNHLNWDNREPTYFISLYDDLHRAQLEVNRRRSQVLVPSQMHQRDPASVRLAEISVRELERLNVFCFSRNDLLRMLHPPPNHPVFVNSSPGEWFVMEHIPDSAVSRIM